jgi:hypothetical protein
VEQALREMLLTSSVDIRETPVVIVSRYSSAPQIPRPRRGPVPGQNSHMGPELVFPLVISLLSGIR